MISQPIIRTPDWEPHFLPKATSISNGDLHLWFIPLEFDEVSLARVNAFLHSDEVQRANRFVRERDRQHFIAARGMLRLILGSYLNLPPAQVQIAYGPQGKPTLSDQTTSLQFNLSHSHQRALLALSLGQDIGVDLEFMRTIAEAEDIAERYFCAREYASLRAAPHFTRQHLFFRYWTCKEAYMKATGKGLTLPPEQIEVLLGPDSSAQLLAVCGQTNETNRWTIQELVPTVNYAAAVAVKGQTKRVRLAEPRLIALE